MRLDKFLQVSRIVKRRTVATKLCNGGKVEVNDRPAKPGKTLAVGDQIALSFGSGDAFVCEVVELPSRGVRKEDAPGLYRTIADTRSRPGDDG